MKDPADTLCLTREHVLQIIVGLQSAGGQAAEAIPLYRAALAGLRLVRVIARDQAFPSRLLTGERPTLVTIGDDDFRASGPAGWSCTRRAMKWPAATIIYAGAGQAEIYAHAVEVARQTGRLLLIETTAEHVLGWYELVPHSMPTLVVSPAFAPGPARAASSETVH